MSMLQKVRILGNERLDLPDFDRLSAFACADLKALHKYIWTADNFVVGGFVATGTGTDTLSVALAGSAAIYGADDGTVYIGAPTLSALSTTNLTPGTTNYVEIVIDLDTGGSDSRAFWDQTAAGGTGGEFSQIVDTFTFQEATFSINTSNFTGDADKLAICEVDVNGGGVITAIRDGRNKLYRLGRRGDVTFDFSWASRTEPATTAFTGADKDIETMKEFIDAVLTTFKEMKGTTYWFEVASVSLIDAFQNAALSVITASGSDSKFTWDGSDLEITDDSGTPADADVIAYVRLFGSSATLSLTREDSSGTPITIADGEVLWIELPDPLANTTYDGTGVTSTDYRVSARASVPVSDTTFWLAYREGSNLYVRGLGELEPGETAEISDNINENILQVIGIASETSDPVYPSAVIVTQNTDLVTAIGELDASLAAEIVKTNEDRNVKLIGGGTWSYAAAASDLVVAELSGTSGNDNSVDTDSRFSQSFDPSSSGALQSARLRLRLATGTPTGNIFYRLYDDNSGEPGNLIASSDALDVTTLTGSFADYTLDFSTNPNISNGTTYHLVFDPSGLTGAFTISLQGDFGGNSFAGGIVHESTDGGSSWTPKANDDLDFTISVDTQDSVTLSADAYIQRPGFADDRNTIEAQTFVLEANEVAYVDLNRTTDSTTNLTVNTADISAVTLNDNRVIFARRDGNDVVIGTHSFRLRAGERLELDGALQEINRLLGQLRITAHESDSDKVRIAGADISLLDGNTLSQELNEFFLSFDGAVIDFTTGEVFESDGSTPLGIDFTPFTIPVSEYFWYALALIPGTISSDNRQNAQLQVTLASAADAVQDNAPKPVIAGDKKLGAVQVQNNAGNIEVVDIRRLGVGSGSGGSGTGDANSIIETLKNRLLESDMELVTPNVFRQDQDTKLDGSSTAAFSFATKTLEFANPSDQMVSIQMLDALEFLGTEQDISIVELMAFWTEGSVDTAATYEVSRDGGNEYQAITMERVGNTGLYRGRLEFEEEAANQLLHENDLTTDDTTSVLDDGTASAKHSQSFVVTSDEVIKNLNMEINKLGSPLGTFRIKIVKDDTGSPSTSLADVLGCTGAQSITALSPGVNSLAIDLGSIVLSPGTYHIVLETDLAYQASYSTGVDEIGVRTASGSIPDSQVFDGSTWSASGDGAWVYELEGRTLDLRVRITSSVGDVSLDAYGIFYDQQYGGSVIGIEEVDRVDFKAVADNENEFTITKFLINTDLLRVYYVQAGQVFRYPAFTVDGNKVIFEVDQFNNGGVEADVTLIFDQTQGGGFDNSDKNSLLMATNHLGSTDASIDKSANGRGIFLRKPNGELRELTIDDSDNIAIYSV